MILLRSLHHLLRRSSTSPTSASTDFASCSRRLLSSSANKRGGGQPRAVGRLTFIASSRQQGGGLITPSLRLGRVQRVSLHGTPRGSGNKGGDRGRGGQSSYQQQHQRKPPGLFGQPLWVYFTWGVPISGICFYLYSREPAPVTGRMRPIILSKESEIEIGDASAKSLLAQFGRKVLPPDYAICKRVKRVGQKLIAASGMDTKDIKWEFYVIDDKMMNAVATPGGKIVVFTGLKQAVTTEDELAAVLGHELSHVIARHSAERLTIVAFMQIGLLFLVLLGVPINELSLMLGRLIVELPNSRTHELEADEIGVLLCAKAGYDPRAAITVFKRMEAITATQGGQVIGFLSTHPTFKDRIAILEKSVLKAQIIYDDEKMVEMMSKGGGGEMYEFEGPTAEGG